MYSTLPRSLRYKNHTISFEPSNFVHAKLVSLFYFLFLKKLMSFNSQILRKDYDLTLLRFSPISPLKTTRMLYSIIEAHLYACFQLSVNLRVDSVFFAEIQNDRHFLYFPGHRSPLNDFQRLKATQLITLAQQSVEQICEVEECARQCNTLVACR